MDGKKEEKDKLMNRFITSFLIELYVIGFGLFINVEWLFWTGVAAEIVILFAYLMRLHAIERGGSK